MNLIRFRRWVPAVGVFAVGALSSVALAQGSPPEMPAITFPVSLSSVATAIVAAGATLLLAYFGVRVGFGFAKKLMNRLKSSV
jgi:hypothetical protein